MPSPLFPPRLRPGDLIGIAAPAGPVTDAARIERGVRYLERLGYRVLVGSHAARVHGYCAGTDDERLKDLHALFRDDRVRAIVALRGGYGSSRLLSRLDYRMIARHPKILTGFSDLTALQLALWTKCRLVTFHGPMLSSDFGDRVDPVVEEEFWRLLTAPAIPLRVVPRPGGKTRMLAAGRTIGRLLGGNLSLIVTLLGTPYSPSFAGGILFFEEVGEEPYRIDRMLTHLRNAGGLRGVRGLLTGRFTDCLPGDPARPGRLVGDILEEMAGEMHVPFLAGLPVGHLRRKTTLPIGVRAALDAGRGTLDLLEAAVC